MLDLNLKPGKGLSIKMNGVVQVCCVILEFVVVSVAEAELGALFLGAKEGNILQILLQELVHKQPTTPIHFDNITAVGIVNDSIKKQQSHLMKMCFFWITDQVVLGEFDVQWLKEVNDTLDSQYCLSCRVLVRLSIQQYLGDVLYHNQGCRQIMSL